MPKRAGLFVFAFLFLLNQRRKFLSLRNELHGNRVHTVTGVFVGQPLAAKDVTKMSIAVGTNDFDPVAIGVGLSTDGSLDFIIKTRPTTVTIEFVITSVELGIALATNIRAVFFGIGVTAWA